MRFMNAFLAGVVVALQSLTGTLFGTPADAYQMTTPSPSETAPVIISYSPGASTSTPELALAQASTSLVIDLSRAASTSVASTTSSLAEGSKASSSNTSAVTITSLLDPLASAVDALADKISGFADHFATNELTFTRATGPEVNTQKLCIGATCVNETQLQALLALTGQAPPNASLKPVATTTAVSNRKSSPRAPTISINGNNPLHIANGTAFIDPGATVTGPTSADTNLGVHVFLDGTEVPTISLDTSIAGTHTIEYVTFNDSGTATSTRKLIIEPARFL